MIRDLQSISGQRDRIDQTNKLKRCGFYFEENFDIKSINIEFTKITYGNVVAYRYEFVGFLNLPGTSASTTLLNPPVPKTTCLIFWLCAENTEEIVYATDA